MIINHTAKVILDLLRPDPEADDHWLELARAVGSACAVEGCFNVMRAKGFCDTHYRQHLRAIQNDAHLINATLRGAA